MEAAAVHSTSPASLVPDESSICWASLDSAKIRSLEPLLPLIPGTLSKYKRSSSCLTIFCTFLSTTSSSCSLKPFEYRLQHQLAILKSLLYTVYNIKLLLSKASCTPATTSSCVLPKRPLIKQPSSHSSSSPSPPSSESLLPSASHSSIPR